MQVQDSSDQKKTMQVLGTDGAAHYVSPAAVANGDSTVVSLNGGQHYAQAVTAGALYEIDSDVDVYVKPSGSPAVYGVSLTANTHAFGRTGQNFSNFTAFDFGTGDFAIEIFCTIEGDTTNNPRPLSLGVASGNTSVALTIDVASSVLTMKADVLDTTGTSPLGGQVTSGSLASYLTSTTLRHFVWNFVRSAGTPVVEFYIDGVKVGEDTYSDGGGSVNISNISSNGICYVGATFGGAANWAGKIFAIRAYKTDLTAAQIARRTGLGPTVLAQDGINASAVLNISAFGSWASADSPEIQDVNGSSLLVLSTMVGSLDVSDNTAAITGDAVASTSNSKRIRAGQPTVIYASGDYLNLYSAPEAAGDVILTRVG